MCAHSHTHTHTHTHTQIDALPEVVDAVEGRIPVFLDGGVRVGSDVFKALAMGARAVFVGRPVLWGLAYDGQAGVERVLEILRDEFVRTMRLEGNYYTCSCFSMHKSNCPF